MLKHTEQLCEQSAKAREQARDGLITHFQQQTEMLPTPEDRERRARMAAKEPPPDGNWCVHKPKA